MAAVWALVRARLRERRRALVGLALLVGVASGAVTAAAIGARRTDTAYDRLLAVTRADDAEVEYGGFDGPPFRAFVDRLGRLPQVADLGVETMALLAPAMPGDPRAYTFGSRFFSVASIDGRAGRTINRPLILAGRRPDPGRVDEIGVSEYVARRWGLRPGGTFRVRAVAPEQLEAMFGGTEVVPAGPALALKVVAVQRLPDDPAIAIRGTEGVVSLTPAFYRAYRDRVANLPSVRVHLKGRQADMGGFAAATRRLAGNGVDVTIVPRADLTRLAEDATRAQAVALVLFAALAAAAALVVVGQTLTRELSLASAGQDTVRALGASRGHLLAASLVPIGLVGAAGAVAGAVIAVLASPLTPMGVALRAEPDPGLAVHLAGLAVGMAATLVLVLARVAVPAWRLAGERPHRPGVPAGTTSALADAAARAGLPPTSVTGLRMALEQGRGPRAVPVRASLAGVTAGIIALTAAVTFGASLDRLLDTPRLYGWNFDAAAGDWRLDDPATSRPPWLADNPLVGAWSAVWFSDIQVNGAVVNGAGFDTAGGRVFPTLVEGREPSGPDELVLGSTTLRRLGLRLGQTVRAGEGRPVAMRIVGRSALVHTDSEETGEGAILTLDGLRRVRTDRGSGYGTFYLRFAPGADPVAATRSLRRLPSGMEQAVNLPQPPPRITNLGRVGALPDVLAGLLALLAASALAHLLVTSVRRRRHDLAILKALGFVRRQVSAAVAWQATTVALVALAVGLPLGVALGRWTWSLLTDRLGLGAAPVTPGAALLAGVAGTVLVANLIAAWPGRVAARTRPAVALRSE